MTEKSYKPDELLAQEIHIEQQIVDKAYKYLDKHRTTAQTKLQEVYQENHSSLPQHRSERDAFAAYWADTASKLAKLEDRLVFGRIDLNDHSRLHIGRVSLNDEERRQVLLDWRAPAARDFYQATALHPGKVVRRRHIATTKREVVGIEDEIITDSPQKHLNTIGEGAILAALNQARDGQMSDIVATIQREQDEVIRASSHGVLVVQGGPGTGKTAVALHRAAYLLYQDRERLDKSGILLIGPSHRFIRYISNVLPSLGETNVVSLTIGEILPGTIATHTEDPAIAKIKGKIIWSKILARAVKDLQKLPTENVYLTVQGSTLELTVKDYKQAHAKAKRSEHKYNEAREIYALHLLEVLAKQYAQAKKTTTTEIDSWVYEDLRETKAVRKAINLYWLPYSAHQLIAKLYSSPARIARLAPEISANELAKLYRANHNGWTVADIPLLDELEEILGPLTTRRLDENSDQHKYSPSHPYRTNGFYEHSDLSEEHKNELQRDSEQAKEVIDYYGFNGLVSEAMVTSAFSQKQLFMTTAERASLDRTWAFGHVVVDEAQELSPMAWRIITRRCPNRSFTIVGDLEQYQNGSPTGGWHKLLGKLSANAQEFVLKVSYRSTKEILDKAKLMLKANGHPSHYPIVAARSIPNSYQTVEYPVEERLLYLQNLLRENLAALDAKHGVGIGNIAIISSAQTVRLAQLHLAQMHHFKPFITKNKQGNSRISIIDAHNAKGIEFDRVILLDPAQIINNGIGDIYVAMTRATSHLTILHDGNLPAGI